MTDEEIEECIQSIRMTVYRDKGKFEEYNVSSFLFSVIWYSFYYIQMSGLFTDLEAMKKLIDKTWNSISIKDEKKLN